jgi:hypothetical protein
MWRAAWLRTRPWNEKRSKTGYFYSIAGLSQFWGQYTVKVQGHPGVLSAAVSRMPLLQSARTFVISMLEKE